VVMAERTFMARKMGIKRDYLKKILTCNIQTIVVLYNLANEMEGGSTGE
jgi:hypothetical protein